MRQIRLINEQWYFSKEAKGVPDTLPADWEQLNLPHTWNGIDGQDGGNDYYRGTCYYAKMLGKEMFAGQEVSYLQFDGVNSSADVYWNGKKLLTHHGGYSTFRVKLEEIKDENLLVVAADNSVNDFIYPQNADFTFYGGIYRDVKIVGVPANHFDLDYYGAPGIKVTPVVQESTVERCEPSGSETDGQAKGAGVLGGNWVNKNAQVIVEAYIDTETLCKAAATCEVKFVIENAEQELVCEQATAVGEEGAARATFTLENAHLWNGVEDPYLYTAKAILLCGGEALDEVSARFGCRSIEFDPEKGFILNGKPYSLRGVSRHQDRPEVGNALTPAQHQEDLALILEMGANTIRLAHYQHAREFYDLCDEKGLVLWAEIPYITTHMPKGLDNTVSQMRELIVQNYNHPSIVTWGVSNEITGGGARDKSMLHNHYVLNDLAHELDQTRPTTMAVLTMCDMSEEIVHITDIVSYNHYFGWYGGNVNMYGPWFDAFHKKYPKRAIGISEYGCEALDWHTSQPQQGDYTEEYQAYYHEELIKMIARRPYLWATHVWNMFDFAADARAEGGENGMNHKGLVTFDRKYKKDAFYAYKAWLSKEPFVHICAKRYVDRVEAVTKVTVYSNQPEVELLANGESVGRQQKGEFPFFYFEVENAGETKLTARAGDCVDESLIRKVDTFNEAYRMKEEGEVLNWFEITAPVGYYSINDTLGDIMSTFRGKLFMIKTAKALLGGKKAAAKTRATDDKGQSDGTGQQSANCEGTESKQEKKSGMGIKLNKTMFEMASGFTVKRVLSMAPMLGSAPLTKEDMLAMNAKLNKIRKKSRK